MIASFWVLLLSSNLQTCWKLSNYSAQNQKTKSRVKISTYLSQRRNYSLPLLMVILPMLQELCRSYCFHGDEISYSMLGVSYALAVHNSLYKSALKNLGWGRNHCLARNNNHQLSLITMGSLMEDCMDSQGPPEFVSFMMWTNIPNKWRSTALTCTAFQLFIAFGSSERKLCQWPFYELYLF